MDPAGDLAEFIEQTRQSFRQVGQPGPQFRRAGAVVVDAAQLKGQRDEPLLRAVMKFRSILRRISSAAETTRSRDAARSAWA